MSNSLAKIKQKLTIMEIPGVEAVMLDLLVFHDLMSQRDSCAEQYYRNIIQLMKKNYKQELPAKTSKIHQRDLEDLIKEIKDGQGKN